MFTEKKQIAIDPRLLIVFTIIYTVYTLLEQSISILLGITFVFTFLVAIRNFNLLRKILILFLITGILSIIFLYFIFPIKSNELMLIYFRITSITGLYTVFYNEINPENLTKALIYFKVPYKYAWTISTSYRYIFLLIDESQEVKNALLIKGVPLDGNIVEKLKNLPVVISLLVFRTNYLSLKFTETLFAKNWSPYGKKTFFNRLNIYSALKFNVCIIILLVLVIIKFIAILTLL